MGTRLSGVTRVVCLIGGDVCASELYQAAVGGKVPVSKQAGSRQEGSKKGIVMEFNYIFKVMYTVRLRHLKVYKYQKKL